MVVWGTAPPLDAAPGRHMDSSEPLAHDLADSLARLAAGDPAARDRIVEVSQARLRVLAHRLLRRFPRVRRWEETDDVLQNVSLRLHRALATIHPASPRDLLGLAARQIHRELIDLARRHGGPRAYGGNHGTNVAPATGTSDPRHIVELAAAPDEGLDRWEAFHAAVSALPAPDRDVFDCVWYMGCDQRTAARLLDCSERTVKARWQTARAAVRAAVDGPPP
ncbi:MAG: RNA polymerase sigma factor [Planctomycetia bacterium]